MLKSKDAITMVAVKDMQVAAKPLWACRRNRLKVTRSLPIAVAKPESTFTGRSMQAPTRRRR